MVHFLSVFLKKICYFDTLFTEIQFIFINFPIQYFLVKKVVKFIQLNTTNRIQVTDQCYGLPKHYTIFPTAN